MDDKVTVEFDAETMGVLNRRAEAHGRGVDDEIRDIVARNIRLPLSRPEFLARAEAIASMTPKGVRQTDSTLLIREDRDR